MAAGQGFKTFTTGEVLTAGDVNGYLMQGVLVFASAAARNAAITSPQEGQFAYTKDTNGLWYYDGAAWVASGATGDIEGVTAGVGISGGGTSGTVTVTNSMATAIDAKGDLVPGTGADTFARLAVGANDTVLTADSTTATGLKWASPAGGALSFTLLNTGGTSLSGSSTVTISSISNKSVILVLINNASSVNASDDMYLRVNGNASNIYAAKGTQLIGYNPYDVGLVSGGGSMTSTNISMGQMSGSSTSVMQASVIIQGCNSTGGKIFNSASGATAAGSNSQFAFIQNGFINETSAITSVSIINGGGNFDAGQIYVYAA